MNIHPLDLTIIIAYIVGIVGLGCWAGMRQRKHAASGKDYFLAGGTLTWPVIGLALFSTNISTIHIIGFAQGGYDKGLVHGNFEWMAPFTLIITALFFAPFYIRSRVATLPDFLEMRYNRPCRDWLAVLSIVAAISMHIGFSLYMGALLLQGMFGLPLMVSIAAIAILTGLYTIVGGLLAVVLTESIQTIILIVGAVIITAISYYNLDGGFAGMSETLQESKNAEMFTILRPSGDPSGLPWYAILLGYPVIGIWYWCADQTIVQRVLGAKDENHARIGPLFCGFLKILPVFLFVLPGLMCFVLVQQGKLDADRMGALPLGSQVIVDGKPVTVADGSFNLSGKELTVRGNGIAITGKEVLVKDHVLYIDGQAQKGPNPTKDTYGFMMRELLPVGVRGIVTAALLAALMGTVSGALNSIATLFSYDIVKRWRPQTSDKALVTVGRVATFVAMLVAIVWSPLLGRFESMYDGIVSMICYIAPPITAVFLLGVFWRRASGVAAQATLYIGSALGFGVFLLDWFKVQFPSSVSIPLKCTGVLCESSKIGATEIQYSFVYMMASFYLFAICVIVQILVSLAYPHQHTPESEKLVWANPLECVRSPGWRGIGDYRILSAVLFITMVVLYVVFA